MADRRSPPHGVLLVLLRLVLLSFKLPRELEALYAFPFLSGCPIVPSSGWSKRSAYHLEIAVRGHLTVLYSASFCALLDSDHNTKT